MLIVKKPGINIVAGVIAVLALAAGAAMALWFDARNDQAQIKTDAFFAQRFSDADDRLQSISQWQGALLVVNFWATWCAPCVEEMPDLQQVQSEYASRGVVVVGVAIDSAGAVKRFRDELKLDIPLLVAGAAGTELVRQLGNASGALPYTVLVGRNGNVLQSKLGRLRAGELRSWLDAQLKAPPSSR